MRSIPSVFVAVLISFLFISPDSRGGSVLPSPEPVSPGAIEMVRLTADRCPTFSWSEVPGAWGYEIAIFSVAEPELEPAIDGTVDQRPIAIDPDSTEPLVRAMVPAGTSSWTPSVEQCLVPGREYSWVIREAGGFGRQVGVWSAASTFAVAESMLWTDQQREIDEVIERLNALAVGFGELPGDPTLRPEWVVDDLYDWVTTRWPNVTDARLFAAQARNHAAGMVPKVAAMAPQLQEIIDIVRENLEFLDESSTMDGVSTQASHRPVREAIQEAKELLRFVLDTAFEGKAEFVGGGCVQGSGSDCARFVEDLTSFLLAFQEVVDLASNLNQPALANIGQGGDVSIASLRDPVIRPELDLSRLITLIEQIPAPALFPLYRLDQELGITAEVDGLNAAIDDIRFLEPILTNVPSPGVNSKGLQVEAIEPCGWLMDPSVPDRETRVHRLGYVLKGYALTYKIMGKMIEASSTTKIRPEAGIHGYAGATIETDVPGMVTRLVDGLENVFTFAGDKVSSTVSECRAAREQQARDAQLQAIQDGLPDQQLLVELEGLSSVPSDLGLVKTAVGDLAVRSSAEHASLGDVLVAHDGKFVDLGDAVQDVQSEIESLRADHERLWRSRIESHIATCAPTLELLLPAVQGGQIETVAEIVETSIATASAIGIKTTNAERSFAKGEGSLSEQDYAGAFGSFCDAYQSLLK